MATPPEYFLGPAASVAAHTEGVPGKRTFYLDLADDQVHARVWVEKQELQALGATIERLTDELGGSSEPSESEIQDAAQLVTSTPTVEFKAGKLMVGYDERHQLFILVLESREEDERPVKVSCSASLSQVRALSERIARVCAAGRPECPLCHGPIDPEGHPCPKSNGHRQLTSF